MRNRIQQRIALAGLLTLVASGRMPAATQFVQHNLVSDLPGVADHLDTGLVNPWGIAASNTSPFWVSDNGAGLSTLYNGNGVAIALKVAVPSPAGASAGGTPTGIVFNPTTAFNVAPGRPATFIFATEQGTIFGWNSGADATHAVLMIDRSATGAVYKGLTMSTRSTGPLLYAANFNSGTVDVFDGNLAPVNLPNAFRDPAIPAGFAPFNIRDLGGMLYVTFAKQDAARHDDVAGRGNGYVDVFDLNGLLLQRLVAGGPLNSPWGLEIAPASFGDFAGALLVGNFGDGAINGYNPATGKVVGTLNDSKGAPIRIPGLWGLRAGNGGSGGDNRTVYFAAGIPGPDAIESHGLFGSIQAAPAIAANSVVNAASFQPGIAPGGFVEIVGSNLAATTRTWGASDFVNGNLPTQLDGVTVTVNGKPAYIYFVSPGQLDVIAPADTVSGNVQVVTSHNGVVSGSVTAVLQAFSPAFFVLSNGKNIAATHADGKSLVGPADLYPGASTPAQPGETIVLYGTGFGPTSPLTDGQVVSAPTPAATQPTVTIGGIPATVTFAGLSSAGLYQLNVLVPDAVPDGDSSVVAQSGAFRSQANAVITVKR
ncbi:MAG: TIGR03118 family protein [Acidobacteriota bacterium]|nr:TIGR03118 family protein [Acidobacteriota bacterium]